MPSFIGHCVFTYDATFQQHITRLQPAALLFLDGDGGALDAANRLPGCKVIAREVNDQYEKNMHRTPGETLRYVQRRASQVNRKCWINIGCEPPTDRLDLLVSEYLKALQWAVDNGVKVAAPHLAHYGLDERHWPTLAPLAKYIGEHPDLLLWTCDEYWAGHAWSGVQDPTLPGGNEAGHIQPETWKSSPTGVYYHCLRIGGLFQYMKGRGMPLPLTVITEGGPDALQDVEAWRESLLHTPGYPKINGWRSLIAQWQAWYGNRGWTPQQSFTEMLKALRRELYSQYPNILAYCVYIYGNNGDPQWQPFNTADPALLAAFETTNTEVPPVTDPIPVPKPPNAGTGMARKLRTTSYIRVRSAPSINAAEVARPTNNTPLSVYYATKHRADGYTWYWVEGDGFSGWQAVVYEFEWEQYLTPTPVPKTFRNPANYLHVILEGGKFNAPRDYSFNPTAKQQHEGLDFSSLNTAARPRVIVAPAEGVVEKVKTDAYYGNYVRVYHGSGWRAYYAHLEKALVTEGQQVREGDPIGWEGSTGNSSGPHLHWTVVHIGYGLKGYVVDEVVDPLPLLKATTPIPDPEPECPPLSADTYAALLEQSGKLEHAHADLVVALQAYTVAYTEVQEAVRSIIGYQ